MSRCLYCYKPLAADQQDWHPACSKEFFHQKSAPVLDLDLTHIAEEGLRVVVARTAIAGVQQKLSIDVREVQESLNSPTRLSVNVGDRFILKPPTQQFPELPELEDATMHLARAVRIQTADHSLFRFTGGEIGYLTRRFDRGEDGTRLPMEDFCQITGRLSQGNEKYKGSIEQIGKAIREHSKMPEIDIARLLDIVLFSFVVGNSDMHLKNYSLLTELPKPSKLAKQPQGPRLSPAYDLVPSQLYGDDEESALTINGKKSKLKRVDFEQAAIKLGVAPVVIATKIKYLTKMLARVEDFLATSFVSPDTQRRYAELIRERLARLQS